MLELTVGRNGEDYYTIQEALDAVPYECSARVTISEGEYREKLFCDKADLTVAGKGDVRICFADSARTIMADGKKRGSSATTVSVSSPEARAQTSRRESPLLSGGACAINSFGRSK